MAYHFIQYQRTARTAFIVLDRAEKRNALNETMVSELREAFRQAAADEQVKVVVLKALGKVFSAGADLQYLEQLQRNTAEENLADSKNLMDLFKQIYAHPKLVIAQVQGHAIAGGCGLATVCDLCYAVPEAKFGYSEVTIGFIPALVSVFLVRKIGEGPARELLLTGRRIEASEAVSIGLINGLMAPDQIDQQVGEKALFLAAHTSPAAVALTKQLLWASGGLNLDDSLSLAATMNAEARQTADCRHGIRAFLEKKEVTW